MCQFMCIRYISFIVNLEVCIEEPYNQLLIAHCVYLRPPARQQISSNVISGTTPPDEWLLVLLNLPRDALIELVVRCRLQIVLAWLGSRISHTCRQQTRRQCRLALMPENLTGSPLPR